MATSIGEDISNSGWVIILIFSFFQDGGHHAKFGDNNSNGGRVIAIFRFSKWRPSPSWIWLDFIFRPPTKSTLWPEATFKILSRSDLYFRRYCDFYFRKFGLKCLFRPQNWGFGGTVFHKLNIAGYHRNPQKALPCSEPRILTYRSSKSVKRGDLQARWTNEKKKSGKQWYFTHAPRPPT